MRDDERRYEFDRGCVVIVIYCVFNVGRSRVTKWQKIVTQKFYVTWCCQHVMFTAEVGVGKIMCYKVITQRNCR
jgi:hypothetical protein